MRRNRRGAAALEFAFTAVVFLTLLFAIIDYGWYFFRRATLQDAVMEGTRVGAAVPVGDSPGPEEVARDKVEAELSARGIDPASATITTTISGSSPAQTLAVDASVPFDDLVAFVPLPTPENIRCGMSMHLEVQ